MLVLPLFQDITDTDGLITENPRSRESAIYFIEILKTLMSILCSANLYMSMDVFLDSSRNVVGIGVGGGSK